MPSEPSVMQLMNSAGLKLEVGLDNSLRFNCSQERLLRRQPEIKVTAKKSEN